jgi:hypothetical protein
MVLPGGMVTVRTSWPATKIPADLHLGPGDPIAHGNIGVV